LGAHRHLAGRRAGAARQWVHCRGLRPGQRGHQPGDLAPDQPDRLAMISGSGGGSAGGPPMAPTWLWGSRWPGKRTPWTWPRPVP